MRIVSLENYFIIVRGKESIQFFDFFVDDDSSCWSKRRDNARLFYTQSQAQEALNKLRHRAKLRRERAGKGDGKPK